MICCVCLKEKALTKWQCKNRKIKFIGACSKCSRTQKRELNKVKKGRPEVDSAANQDAAKAKIAARRARRAAQV